MELIRTLFVCDLFNGSRCTLLKVQMTDSPYDYSTLHIHTLGYFYNRYSKTVAVRTWQRKSSDEIECVLQYDAAEFSYVISMSEPRHTGKRTQYHLSLAFERFKQCFKE